MAIVDFDRRNPGDQADIALYFVKPLVMITEVLFASGSAVLLGAGQLTLQLLAGGALIVGATLLAAR